MIQRQQTLWLILAAVSSFLTYKFPFYTGTLTDGSYSELDGGSSFFLLILTGLTFLLAVITIFLFKDRKTQLKLAIAGIILSVIVIILYVTGISNFLNGSVAFSAIFAIAMLVGFILAARGIWKDEKLVKSLDKLR